MPNNREQANQLRILSGAGVCLLFLVLAMASVSSAQPSLEIEPITWDVIGLDSNSVVTGPDTFPVGARVCNTGTADATGVTATLIFDSANAYINLVGSATQTLPADLPFGSPFIDSGPNEPTSLPSYCTDFYWEVKVTRIAAAYNTTRTYHIDVTSNAPTVSTPANRQLYVEKLISQNRNEISSVAGPSLMIVGNTYNFIVTGKTATGGYEQFVMFLTVPNSIFQIVGVSAKYAVPAAPNNTNNATYADACGWDADSTSGNYRSCVGPQISTPTRRTAMARTGSGSTAPQIPSIAARRATRARAMRAMASP